MPGTFIYYTAQNSYPFAPEQTPRQHASLALFMAVFAHLLLTVVSDDCMWQFSATMTSAEEFRCIAALQKRLLIQIGRRNSLHGLSAG
jgi:hypothetical protein